MADKKISALSSASTPLAGTEVLPIVQSGDTVKVPVSDLTAGRAVSGTSFAAGAAASIQTLSGTGITASGTDANINFRITPKATAYAEVYANLNGFSATGQSILVLNNTAGSGQSPIDFIINGTLRGRVRTDFAGGVTYVSNGGGHEFLTGGDSGVGTKRLAIASGGDVTVSTGNLVQGTAAKGVNFTANTPAAGMTSQLMNWYEEGTWTPVISSNGSGSPTFTATTQSGRYTRIGRQVTVICEYVYTDRGTVGGSYAFMTALPFTSNGKSWASITIQQGSADTNNYTAYVPSGGTTIQFLKNNYGGAAGALLGTDFPASGTVEFTLIYFV